VNQLLVLVVLVLVPPMPVLALNIRGTQNRMLQQQASLIEWSNLIV
jgi:hypothetical protein